MKVVVLEFWLINLVMLMKIVMQELTVMFWTIGLFSRCVQLIRKIWKNVQRIISVQIIISAGTLHKMSQKQKLSDAWKFILKKMELFLVGGLQVH